LTASLADMAKLSEAKVVVHTQDPRLWVHPDGSEIKISAR